MSRYWDKRSIIMSISYRLFGIGIEPDNPSRMAKAFDKYERSLDLNLQEGLVTSARLLGLPATILICSLLGPWLNELVLLSNMKAWTGLSSLAGVLIALFGSIAFVAIPYIFSSCLCYWTLINTSYLFKKIVSRPAKTDDADEYLCRNEEEEL